MKKSFAKVFSEDNNYGNCLDIYEVTQVEPFLERVLNSQVQDPAILRGFAADWPAVRNWDEEYFLDRYGELEISPTVGLPDHGVPYINSNQAARCRMNLREFLKNCLPKGHCYIDQHPLSHFPGIQRSLPIQKLLGDHKHIAKFWFGKGTKSGLHFDALDNFLVMIRGKKTAVLASPKESKNVYPFLDRTTKSQLDVESPDFSQFPRAMNAELWIAEIGEGDVLFIPLHWWHNLSSSNEDYSISVNSWFGKFQPLQAITYNIKLGPRYIGKILRDFLVHGLLQRPYFERVFSGAPQGVQLYYAIRNRFNRLFGVKT